MKENYLRTTEILRNTVIITIVINIILLLLIKNTIEYNEMVFLPIKFIFFVMVLGIELIIGVIVRITGRKNMANGIFFGIVVSMIIKLLLFDYFE
ncbi:MAG: hypothetical protein HY819_17320 [Acidobacteria bacterium]|nr:hypothetical protein [Acidobacteriota bacterium]